jgi:hypothetical protein
MTNPAPTSHTTRVTKPTPRATAKTHPNHVSPHVIIGVILSNGEVRNDRFKCHVPSCSGVSFGRLAELKRHHTCRHGGHEGKTPRFWCPVDGCKCMLFGRQNQPLRLRARSGRE